MNVLTELERAGGASAGLPPAPGTVEADLARGRRRLRGLRRRRLAGSAVALSGVVAAAVSLSPGTGPHAPAAQPAHVLASAPAQATSPAPAALVSYPGPQVTGFHVARIPAGWRLTLVDRSFVQLTSPAPLPAPPCVCVDFANRVTVAVNQEPDQLTGARALTVHGAPASLGSDGLGRVLTFRANGRAVTLQARDVALTDDQLVDIADGIAVTKDVVPVGG